MAGATKKAAGKPDLAYKEEPWLLTSFGYLVRRIYLHSVQQYAALLGERLQFSQYVLLQVIDHHAGETQGAIAAAAGLDRTTVVPLVEAMVKKGWVRRTRRRDSRRAYSVRLTEAGAAMAAEARTAVGRNDATMLQGLAPDERDQLVRLLGQVFREAADPGDAPPA